MGISLFSRDEVRVQHFAQIFNIHAGLLSTYLFETVLLCQVMENLSIALAVDAHV